MSTTNTPDGTPRTYTRELEDKILAVLPKRIKDFILYDAPFDADVLEVFKALRAGHTTDILMSNMRGTVRRDTRAVYGPNHPQA